MQPSPLARQTLLALALVIGAAPAGAQAFRQNATAVPTGGPPNSSFTENLAFADVDLDGDLDVVWADGGDLGNDRNRIWINQGGLQAGAVGTFVDETSTRLPSVQDDSRDIDFCDLDLDGDLDFLASNTSGVSNQGSRVYLNQGGAQGGTVGFYAEGTAATWVNVGVNDGVTSFSSVAPSLVLPEGNFIDWSCDTGFADLDGDGDPDLFNATYGDLSTGKVPTRVFLNDGAGKLEEFNPSGYQLSGTNLTNGSPALWCQGTHQHDTLDTTGAEADVALIAISVDFGDLDGDFDVDVVHGEKVTLPRIFRNLTAEDGALGFRDVTHAVMTVPDWAPGLGSYEQELGDLDDDGDLDLWGGNWDAAGPGPCDSVLLAAGGLFGAPSTTPNSCKRHNEACTIDYDGDGDLDLFIASETNIELVYENLGAAGGWALLDRPDEVETGVNTAALGVDPADVDQDGDYDVFVASDLGQPNTFFENTTNVPDTTPPRVPALEQAPDRDAGFAPTVVRAHVLDVSWDLTQFYPVDLEYRVDGGPFTAAAMRYSGGQVFRGEVPGLTEGLVEYRVRATDMAGNVGLSVTLGYLAGPCTGDPIAYCTAGTSASGCQALIQASGTPSATLASGFFLSVAGMEGDKNGLYFYGTNGRQANPWGNGTSWVCVVPPRVRGGLLTGVGTAGQCDGAFSQDLNARWCPTCPKPQHNPGAGALMQAQLWYRDPQSTSNQSSSMSDAIEFTICP